MRLRIVFRFVAEPISVGIVIPRSLVPGDAVNDLVADVGMFETNTDELPNL